MSIDLEQTIKELFIKLEQLRGYLDIAGKEKRLNEIEYLVAKKDFWDNPEETRLVLKERTVITNKIKRWKRLYNDLEESKILFGLAREESDADTIEEATQQVRDIKGRIKEFSLDLTLSAADDQNNAIVSINAGAGGTDAQDWVEMLFRMYTRWVEQKGFKISIIDYQPGDEAGIKSVTFTANGEYAYGYLKTENGVHRLVRISPFNASGKRQTSFASVFVYPELDNEIKIDIDDKDLRIDVFRASGAGGQHINKTSSAVRITHLTSGIVVQCQQERSQYRNKEMAMKVLKARLYQREKLKQDEKMHDLHENKNEIAWGSQIRSYVLQPYQMVKDHRINLEVGDVNNVLNGGLDPFIEGVLLSGKT
ncbi:MAG: peptide chain release factor 2 [Candidatus Desulfaltia sp.]|nr:peptide chain release factor 2 [Candidatus Desulfaltia sp.]